MSNLEIKRKILDKERLLKASAVTTLGLAAFNGVNALESHNESVQAETTATILETQGNPQAAEWNLYADELKTDRNMDLGLAAIYLVSSGAMGMGVRERARNRQQEEAVSSDAASIPSMRAPYPYR